MAWYVQGGKVVVGPGGQIFDNGASTAFNFFISTTGDDNNAGTLASPWSITALNSKGATYAGKRVGLLPGTYQYGIVGGVQTTLFALCNSQNTGTGHNPTATALAVNGGTTTSTYVASCDASGNYSPRTAVLSAMDPGSGNLPTSETSVIGQPYNTLANKGNVTLDGLVVRDWNQWGISFMPGPGSAYPTTSFPNIRIQNCEVTAGQGYENDNMGGIILEQCAGVYVGNNLIHNIIPTSGNVTQQDCAGIFSFLCYSNIYELNTIYNVNTGIYDKLGNNGNHTHRYNLIEMVTPASSNAALTDCFGGHASDTLTIHHNIFYVPGAAPNSGAVCSFSPATQPYPGNVTFYNNTVIYGSNNAVGILLQVCGGTVTNYNNIIVLQGVHASTGLLTAYSAAYTGTADYNIYDDSTHAPNLGLTASASSGATITTYNLAAWQTATGKETNSLVGTPTFAGAFGFQNAVNYQLTGSVGVGSGRVGGISSGAAINAGAWDGIVAQLGCNFNSIAPATFPLAGGVFIAGSVQTSFGNPTFQAQVATLGVAVIGLYPGWTSGGYTYTSAPAAVKAINPNIKLVPYTNIMELESGVGSSGSPYSPIFNAATTMNWFLRTAWPAGSITDADGNAQDGLNQTTFTVAGTGAYAGFANYLAWRAFWSGANEYGTNWDGLYMDNCFSKPRVTADYNQSGSGQTAAAATANWQAGYAAYIPLIRAKLPANSLVFANAADWEVVSISPTYNRLWDSGAMESIVGGGGSLENSGWSAMMNLYSTTMVNCRTPNYSIFMQDGSVTNYAGMRYGLCSCLLDNAYYYHTNNGNYDTVETYDELSFNLGAQIAGPNSSATGTYSNSGLSVWTQGVWRRDFVNGIILLNPRGNGSQTVTLETTYYTLRGVQDPVVNNHSPVTSVTLPDTNVAGTGGSGIFLSRTAT